MLRAFGVRIATVSGVPISRRFVIAAVLIAAVLIAAGVSAVRFVDARIDARVEGNRPHAIPDPDHLPSDAVLQLNALEVGRYCPAAEAAVRLAPLDYPPSAEAQAAYIQALRHVMASAPALHRNAWRIQADMQQKLADGSATKSELSLGIRAFATVRPTLEEYCTEPIVSPQRSPVPTTAP